jgi:TonB family protein
LGPAGIGRAPTLADNEFEGGTVSVRTVSHWFAVGLLLASGCVATTSPAWGQEINRRLKSKIAPAYPDLARRMNLTGVVKVQVTIDKNGTVKNAKLMGGSPVLAGASLDAVTKWKYEPGPEETTGIVEFRFTPNQ